MIIKIKGIRKYRITHDDLNWIIQQRMPNQKPPNDWINKFHHLYLKDMVSHLAELGIKDEKLTDIKKVLNKLTSIQTQLKKAVEEMEHRLLEQNIDIISKPPASKRTKAAVKAKKKR